ncbi:hypothetical protein LTR56_011504 [Elasticomyces elasticus]|nr:hypothetical protein LTR22_020380 [Elasticomyces elasticus]KAK3641058.1 hypothetical protein LTR56_011504 [Elasticomyces elasticus]KAK4930224.1 hypothetical protein LTR49_003258 [Elasticomyces elasticus]KAK5761387.1 hypothetical protein LTS12_008491 [Elasticomyces elasticus]
MADQKTTVPGPVIDVQDRPTGMGSTTTASLSTPNKHGDRVVAWYKSVFEKGSSASAFLGGALLAITTSGPEDHIKPIRNKAAAGATLFLILFLLCLGLPLLFEFHGDDIVHLLDQTGRGKTHRLLAVLSLVLQGLALSGAACLFLVIVPFVPIAGWIGLGVTGILACIAFVFWLMQLCGIGGAFGRKKEAMAGSLNQSDQGTND